MSLDLSHAFMAGRISRRVGRMAAWHPGWFALGCFFLWRVLVSPAVMAGVAPVTYVVGHGQTSGLYTSPGLVGGVLFFASIVRGIGIALMVTAAWLAVTNIRTAPTHQAVGGRLRPVGRGAGRPSLAARRHNPGAYARIKAGRGGLGADWRASKGNAADVERRLARVGRWRLKRWGRQWGVEDRMGAERSQPGRIDRWLIRRNDPPTTKRGQERAEKRAEKRTERKAGPAPYPDDTMPPPPPQSPPMPDRPRPGHDPAAPPSAPPAPAPEPAPTPPETEPARSRVAAKLADAGSQQ